MDVKKSEQLGSSCDDSVNDTEKSSDVKTNKGKPTFDFNERTFKEDITLVVEGEKLYVSKSVLASASPVFDRMFHSDFKEKDLTEFNLPGKRVSEMQEFLRFIYSERSVDVSDVNVYKLLPLAEEYQVASMKAKCEEFFISRLNNELDASDFKNILQIAANYNMDDLLDKFCENIPEQFVRDLISEELPNRIVKKILDKMMERLEHIRKRNMWLEGIHKYSVSGQSRVVQKDFERDLREYKNWKCQSLFPAEC